MRNPLVEMDDRENGVDNDQVSDKGICSKKGETTWFTAGVYVYP